MKQYKFTSRSAFSFAVTHNGRQMYVNFSPTYRGISLYITTDESLAKKIRAHRWYREGRITDQIVEVQPAKKEKPYQPVMPPEPKKYSILGKPMAVNQPQKPQQKEESVVKENLITEQSEVQQEPQQTFVADEVTSFMEAKEFFITNYGVQRSDVSSRDAIAALCKELNVTFPNYPL